MRKAADDRAKQDEVSQDNSLANIQVVDHQGERVPVRAVWKDEDVPRS
jgi:U3 small nucleolar ribonucleoprotein component